MSRSPDPSPPWRRWGTALLLLAVSVFAVLPVLDDRAEQNYESLFQRALVTFALARTLNGVISAVQGTELALQPAGVGVTLTPGEVLDPVNDLVERFSWIMLGATVSLGVQSVLLEISAWWVLQGVVVVLALWLLVLRWRFGPSASTERALLWRALLVAVFLRFAVPLTLVANEVIYDLFLESRYVESTEVIEAAGKALENLEAEAPPEAPTDAPDEATWLDGVLRSLGATVDGATGGLSLSERVDAIQARAAAMIEHLIQLSVVFVLQTGLLPLAFLWLFLQAAKWLFSPPRRPPGPQDSD